MKEQHPTRLLTKFQDVWTYRNNVMNIQTLPKW
jgi:hypothetical protein